MTSDPRGDLHEYRRAGARLRPGDPARPHDRDHRLKVVLAPEASPRDIAEFRDRFGVTVVSGYGSSEGGIVLVPAAQTWIARDSLAGADIAVVNASGMECETAQFDSDGRLSNVGAAIGELVRRNAAAASRGTGTTPRRSRTDCAGDGSGRVIWPTATPTTFSGSRAG